MKKQILTTPITKIILIGLIVVSLVGAVMLGDMKLHRVDKQHKEVERIVLLPGIYANKEDVVRAIKDTPDEVERGWVFNDNTTVWCTLDSNDSPNCFVEE